MSTTNTQFWSLLETPNAFTNNRLSIDDQGKALQIKQPNGFFGSIKNWYQGKSGNIAKAVLDAIEAGNHQDYFRDNKYTLNFDTIIQNLRDAKEKLKANELAPTQRKVDECFDKAIQNLQGIQPWNITKSAKGFFGKVTSYAAKAWNNLDTGLGDTGVGFELGWDALKSYFTRNNDNQPASDSTPLPPSILKKPNSPPNETPKKVTFALPDPLTGQPILLAAAKRTPTVESKQAPAVAKADPKGSDARSLFDDAVLQTPAELLAQHKQQQEAEKDLLRQADLEDQIFEEALLAKKLEEQLAEELGAQPLKEL